MKYPRVLVVAAIGLCTALWTYACGDGTTDPPPPDPPRATTVTVTPATAELTALGETVRFTAQVLDQNGQAMAGAPVAWSSGNATVATVDASGLVTAAGNGTATITASSGSASGTAAVTVMQAVSAVAVSPAADTLVALGDTVRLTAEASDANGHAVAGTEFEWASNDTLVAVVDDAGLVTAAGKGTATITASSGSASGTAAVTVMQAVSAVAVSPAADTLVALGDTVRLTAEASDANGHAVAGTEFEWASSDTLVAVVDDAGLVTAAGKGTATITASSGSASGTAAVTVMQAVSAVAVSPAADTLVALGDTVRLTAEASDANGHAVAGTEFEWASSDTLVAVVDDAGLVTGVGPGEVEVTATAAEATGRAALTVLAPAPTTVVVTPDTVALTALGQTAQLAAEVGDQIGRTMEGVPVSWSSADTLVAAVDSAGLVTAIGGGATTIAATAGEVSGTAAVTVLQSAGSVIVSPSADTVALGDTLRLAAEAFDANGHRVEGAEFRWSSSDFSVATVDGSGLVRGVAEGAATITATAGDARGTAEITIENPDRTALVALYNATDGPNWANSDNWLTDESLGDWYGVDTDDSGRVVWMQLRENNLAGPIPTELGNLASLERLDLSGNPLSGTIPAELGNLAHLRDLVLQNDALSGPIPAELGNLTNLRSLWLNGNVLSGPIPTELGNLANLVTLNLQFNDLAGAIPRSFLTLDRLQGFFVLGGNSLCVPGAPGFAAWISGLDVDVGSPAAYFCNAADVTMLTGLYEAAGGEGWMESAGWLGDGAIEEWYGVSADSLGRVTALDLARNGLVGKLSAGVGSLAAMTVLRIGGNDALSGRLPLLLATVPLDELHYADTELCVPADESFEAWLNTIPSHQGTGVECPLLSDREILEILYGTTGGPDWTNNDNWLSDAPLRDWHGIHVDGGGRVYGLNLFENNLTGSLPGELGQLDELSFLYFGQNWELTGPIPPQLGNLANLEQLHLQFTDLTGPIPPELGRLSELTDLYVWRTGLSGPLPPELGNLVNLTRLLLGENELTGPIPSTLGNLADLRELRLTRNALNGPIPRELGNLSELAYLSLGQNDLTGPIPPELAQLANLKELAVANNTGMSGALPESLTAIRGLDEFTAGGTGLCAPSDPAFRAWLAGIRKRRVAVCDGGDAAAYLVQSVQSRDHPVPLVAGERALLRVFPTALRASGAGMPSVRARFYLDDRETHVANIPETSAPIPTEVDEGRLAKSANAEIPGHVVQPGLEMVIEIDPQGTLDPTLGVAKRIPEAGRLAVEVRAMPTLDLTVVPFLWTADPDSAILRITSGMAADPENHEMLWATRTLLPVGNMVVRAHEPVLTTTNHASTFFGEMVAIRALEGGTGHWMAMMSGDVDDQGGFAVGNRLNYSWPAATIIAHELGHNMSLGHAPCGGPDGLDGGYPYPDGSSGVWGYDFEDGGGLVHPSRPDLMSYCGPRWVSDYHFTNALRYRLVDEVPSAAVVAASVPRRLLLWGGIDADTVPYLEPAFFVDAPPALPDSAGAYTVTGRTAGGEELFALSFAMPETFDGDGSSSFAFVLPVRTGWEGNLASISLLGPGGSFTLDGDSDIPMAILRNPRTGQIRGVLRDPPPATQAAANAVGQGVGTRLDVLFSRGIPGTEAWRR